MEKQQRTTKRASRIAPAMLPYDQRGRLLTLYLQCYIAEAGFCHDLRALYGRHYDTISAISTPSAWMDVIGDTMLDRTFAERPGGSLQNPALVAYADDVTALVKRRKLDLITGGELYQVTGGEGYQAVHGWCIDQRYFTDAPRVDYFGGGLAFGGWKPEVGEVVQEVSIARDQKGNCILITGERRIPRVYVEAETVWEAGYETIQQAEERLDKQYEEKKKFAFAALRQQYEEAGYIFPSGQTQEIARHIQWTYLHVARSYTYAKISVSEGGTNIDVIRKRVRDYAKVIGLVLSRPHNRTA